MEVLVRIGSERAWKSTGQERLLNCDEVNFKIAK